MELQKIDPMPWELNLHYDTTATGRELTRVFVKDAADNLIATFHGPAREANAQLFMDAPGMEDEIKIKTNLGEALMRRWNTKRAENTDLKEKIAEIARSHGHAIDEHNNTVALMEAQHDAAIEALKMYQAVEVRKLQAEIEGLKKVLDDASAFVMGD